MGHAITYCYKCSTRILEEDFARGKAFYVGDHVACAACAPQVLKETPTPSPASQKRSPGSSSTLNRVSTSSTRKLPIVREEPVPRNRLYLMAGAGGVGVVLLVVAQIGRASCRERV